MGSGTQNVSFLSCCFGGFIKNTRLVWMAYLICRRMISRTPPGFTLCLQLYYIQSFPPSAISQIMDSSSMVKPLRTHTHSILRCNLSTLKSSWNLLFCILMFILFFWLLVRFLGLLLHCFYNSVYCALLV